MFLLALGADAPKIDFKLFYLEAGRLLGRQLRESVFGQVNVVDGAARIAMKVGVFVEISTKPGRIAIAIDLADQTALDEGFKAIVNGRERDARHFLPDLAMDVIRGWVRGLGHEHFINQLALPSHSQAIAGQRFVEHSFCFVAEHRKL